jgi:signal transduction histidine kinase/CheY-like chemotaxis protein
LDPRRAAQKADPGAFLWHFASPEASGVASIAVTAERHSDAEPAGGLGQGERGTALSREIREETARSVLSWALPTLTLMICAFLVLLARFAGAPPTRMGVLAVWLVALLSSGWFYFRGQMLRAAGTLLVGLVVAITTGTLLNGVDAPAFAAMMPVIALAVPLFGVRWGVVLLGWHALTGVAAIWLGSRGAHLAVAPLSNEVRVMALLMFSSMTLAFLYAPTRLLVRSLRMAEARLHEAEQSRERERQSALALRHTSEQLAQARRLEALGKLSGGVAHDFNNMLGAVMAATDLIALDRTGREAATLDEHLEIIRSATERAADLTRKLLAFGRQDHFGAQPIDVNVLVRETAALARPTMGARIKLELDCAPGELWVQGDRSALDHALLNLLLNARDAVPGDGKICIRTREVTLEAAWCEASGFAIEAGRAVQLSVEDSGCGMPPEVRERLFEPFFTTKPRGRGTGLGLSAVHGTVSSQKGALEVHSEPGRGTVFHVYLPLGTQAERTAGPAKPPRASAPVRIARGTVLVIDDDQLHGRAVAGLVRQLGYEVQQLPNARAALELLSAGADVSAVISDVVMPDMNGPALAQALAERTPRLSVVLMTGFAPDGALASLPPHVPVLRKPFGRDELQAAISAAADSSVSALAG